MFRNLPQKLNHPALEEEILERWAREATFEQLRNKNLGGPRFSFIDGPVTANKTLGVHTAWGRTLKDVFQRYKALRGFHQRYQNGFDCQGLWIEVGVERELGFNSKQEIEEFGLENFARECRAVVERSSAELTKSSIRLGQWMDWKRSYFTFSDTNIEYIWRFLRIVHERGWLYRGHGPTQWCSRCGTSISAHELVGSYTDREDPALSVRFPLLDRPGESVVIWTTTPWTLPANVAAAVHPDAQYGRRHGDWSAVERSGGSLADFDEVLYGREMIGWRYTGPFDSLCPGAPVEHRVVPWAEVSMSEGTGIVHIAPGCGAEDFMLAGELGLPALTPVDESGKFYDDYGWLAGKSTAEAAEPIIESLQDRDLLVEAGTIEHRYPECWRCHTPLIFRLSNDWFISVADLREPMRVANRSVNWEPAYMGKQMDDWLVNMGDWNISRRRYYGLPLPIYVCGCGHTEVVGSRAQLAELATGPLDNLVELRRPWIDSVTIRCPVCGAEVQRILEVGDVWLDAGIVPFSTLGWQNPRFVPAGYGTGAAKGLTEADLPDHTHWEEWFPATWVSEMREQIRLWFYAQLFMSVVLTGQAPFQTVLGYEKMLDEHGREMHGSWGNTISAEHALSRMGADVMRWQYCMQPPNQNLLFGFGPAQEVQRKLIKLWNSVLFFIQYANLVDFGPVLGDAPDPTSELDRWLVARTSQLVSEATDGYERYLTVSVLRAFEQYLDDLSNWYIRRSRRRFWDGDYEAIGTLWFSLVKALQVISPVLPFLSEHLWEVLVSDVCDSAPASIFLAGWPEVETVDELLLEDLAAVRHVVELGHQARSAARLKVRQPLRRLVVEGADRVGRYVTIIADELRIKEVVVGQVDATEMRVRPNLPRLGPRLGPELPRIRTALAAGEFEALEGGGFRVEGIELGPEEVLVERTEKEGWTVVSDEGVTVGLDTAIDDDLRLEARVYDAIHRVNLQRKAMGLEMTDRIGLELPDSEVDLLRHREWIMAETLAVKLDIAPDEETHIVRVTRKLQPDMTA